jgi:hypothetical protein
MDAMGKCHRLEHAGTISLISNWCQMGRLSGLVARKHKSFHVSSSRTLVDFCVFQWMRGLCGSVGSSSRGAGITDFVSLVMLSKLVLQWFPLRTGARWGQGSKGRRIYQTVQQGLVTVPFWVYWTSPYSSHYRPYT